MGEKLLQLECRFCRPQRPPHRRPTDRLQHQQHAVFVPSFVPSFALVGLKHDLGGNQTSSDALSLFLLCRTNEQTEKGESRGRRIGLKNSLRVWAFGWETRTKGMARGSGCAYGAMGRGKCRGRQSVWVLFRTWPCGAANGREEQKCQWQARRFLSP